LTTIDDRTLKGRGGRGAFHGITRFADMSKEEFQSRYLTAKRPEKRLAKQAPDMTYTGESLSVDWSGVYTTAVQDQGYCGSCWAFSASEQIESDAIREGLLTSSDKLSPQQIISCDSDAWGCNGGYTEYAYAYVGKVGGLSPSEDYPYTSYMGLTGVCRAHTSDFQVRSYMCVVKFVFTLQGWLSVDLFCVMGLRMHRFPSMVSSPLLKENLL
jgi:hypothetical protein